LHQESQESEKVSQACQRIMPDGIDRPALHLQQVNTKDRPDLFPLFLPTIIPLGNLKPAGSSYPFVGRLPYAR
jgi:hypothetical protein